MARRIRSLYHWNGSPGIGSLEPSGWISEASLRAWEYEKDTVEAGTFAEGEFHDTVRRWKTSRPDLADPEELLVGDYEVEAAR